MISEESKQSILTALLRIVSHIVDEDYQVRTWIKGIGPYCDDFDEAVNSFASFEACITGHYDEYKFTDDQREIYIKFRDAFEEFSDHNDMPINFDVVWWYRIMDLAFDLIVAFQDHKYVVEERKIRGDPDYLIPGVRPSIKYKDRRETKI